MALRTATPVRLRTPNSFPGLLALVTGGSPISHGLFYDVSYDRTLFDPSNVTCKGAAGNMMVFDESIDLYNGNVSQNVHRSDEAAARTQSRAASASRCFRTTRSGPTRSSKSSRARAAAPLGRTSTRPTISSMARRARGVDDLYTPEITNVNGFDATVSVDCTVANDAA